MLKRAPLALGIALATVASTASPVSAQIPLRVRAETRLELRLEGDEGELLLQGTLRDDLGAPLAGRPIAVVIEGGAGVRERAMVHTDVGGAFALRVDAPSKESIVRAEFAGDAHHDGTEAARTVRPGLEDVRLALTVPGGGVFDLDARRHPITIIARAASGPAPVRIELLDELGRRIGEGVANDLGRLRLELTPSVLGAAGAGRLVARSFRDSRFAASQTEVPIVRMRPTRIELRASPSAARPGARIRLHGRLFAADGGRPHEAVGIFLEERHVRTVLTDDRGYFEADATLPATEADAVAFSARYEPNGPGHGPSISSPTFVRALSPSPYGWALRLAPPLALFLLWAAARSLRRGIRGLGPRRLAARSLDPRADRPMVSRVRGLHGHVLGEADVPLPGALVRFSHGDGPSGSVTTDAEGRFAIGELPRGEVEIAAAADGYAETIARRTLPVRPRDAEIVIRLSSLRGVALAAYQETAEPWLESPDAWPTTTNARAAALAPPSRRREAAELALEVDRVYYGPGPADPAEVEQIVRSAEEQRNNAEPLHRTR